MMRHIDIPGYIINNLLKKVYYREQFHYNLFKDSIKFLFIYAY